MELRRLERQEHLSGSDLQALWIQQALDQPLFWLTAKAGQVAEIWNDPISNWAWYGPSLKLFEPNAFALPDKLLRGWHIFLFACLLVGLIWSPEREMILLAALYLGASGSLFFLAHYMPRFRMSLQPILIPFTAYGIYRLADVRGRLQAPESKMQLGLTAALLILFGISLVA